MADRELRREERSEEGPLDYLLQGVRGIVIVTLMSLVFALLGYGVAALTALVF